MDGEPLTRYQIAILLKNIVHRLLAVSLAPEFEHRSGRSFPYLTLQAHGAVLFRFFRQTIGLFPELFQYRTLYLGKLV